MRRVEGDSGIDVIDHVPDVNGSHRCTLLKATSLSTRIPRRRRTRRARRLRGVEPAEVERWHFPEEHLPAHGVVVLFPFGELVVWGQAPSSIFTTGLRYASESVNVAG